MNMALWVIQSVLAVVYVAAGSFKFFQTANAREQLSGMEHQPDTFIRFVGGMELLGALGLILPWLTGILPWLTPLAAAGLTLVQLLAIGTVHVPRKDYRRLPMNSVLLLLALVVVVGRFWLVA
jgi:uncharacterized membrane protein YphA (DoxX/SURF4 family)